MIFIDFHIAASCFFDWSFRFLSTIFRCHFHFLLFVVVVALSISIEWCGDISSIIFIDVGFISFAGHFDFSLIISSFKHFFRCFLLIFSRFSPAADDIFFLSLFQLLIFSKISLSAASLFSASLIFYAISPFDVADFDFLHFRWYASRFSLSGADYFSFFRFRCYFLSITFSFADTPIFDDYADSFS